MLEVTSGALGVTGVVVVDGDDDELEGGMSVLHLSMKHITEDIWRDSSTHPPPKKQEEKKKQKELS